MLHHCKIAEKGLVYMVQEMNNALTNIRLSADLMATVTDGNKDGEMYHTFIAANISRLQETMQTLCNSFTSQGYNIFIDDQAKMRWDNKIQ